MTVGIDVRASKPITIFAAVGESHGAWLTALVNLQTEACPTFSREMTFF
jgi:hypothetical protein